MGQSDQYRTDLAREREAHRRTQDKLMALEERMEAAEAQILVEKAAFTKLLEQRGLLIKCADCDEVLTKPGALRLHIGVPDKDDKFEGVIEHICVQCEKGE